MFESRWPPWLSSALTVFVAGAALAWTSLGARAQANAIPTAGAVEDRLESPASPSALSAREARRAPPGTAVWVPSLDRKSGEILSLPGFWMAAPGQARAAALVLLHGCGGPYASRGARAGSWSAHLIDYAHWLNARGIHALMIDSFSPRGERELCTQPMRQRRIDQTQRRRDALGALAWLAGREEVDPQRVGLIGWSHGGSTVLAATNLAHAEVRAANSRAALAVAFYPGCSAELARGYSASGPSLLLLGAEDDWTAPGPCLGLVEHAAMPRPDLLLLPGAHHGFDRSTPLVHRPEVPNGVRPGQGVHVGGNALARAAALARLADFLRQHGFGS